MFGFAQKYLAEAKRDEMQARQPEYRLQPRALAWQGKRTNQRVLWLIRRIAATYAHSVVAWDQETVDAFVSAFPEADKTLIVYSMGPHSSPMLNRTAKRAEALGYLKAGRIGNQDARSYNQRTWCRCWSLTDLGKAAVIEAESVVEPHKTGDKTYEP